MNETLSVCIPTFNRSGLLLQTLESLLPQLKGRNIPVYIRDNASLDNTVKMVEAFRRDKYPFVFLRRNEENVGADINIRRVVEDATTDYCWLFGDDDLPCEGAVSAILAAISNGAKFIVVNSSVYKSDMTTIVIPNKLDFAEDRVYESGEHSRLLLDVAQHASSMSCMIVNRSLWLTAADVFYPPNYPHIGAGFMSTLGQRAIVIGRQLVRLRLGGVQASSSWKFNVLMICWPNAIWGLPESYDEKAKRSITIRNRRSSIVCIVAARALGMFDRSIYEQFYAKNEEINRAKKNIIYLISCVPKPLCNLGSIVYLYLSRPKGYQVLIRDILETSC